MIKLYRQNANSIGTWRIWGEGSKLYIAHATVQGGSEVRHMEHVQTNLSGRTLEEQMTLRIKSRISRMLDKGYKYTVEDAVANPGNQLGLDRPMLAQQVAKVKNINLAGAVLQKKLDGHRCLITKQDDITIAYTRQGKEIPVIHHLTRALDTELPEGVTLDGELYCHGIPLQTIGSWIKREQPGTLSLFYVVYDLISNDRYVDRHAELSEIVEAVGHPHIVTLPYRQYDTAHATSQYFKEVRAGGFEGLMLRLDGRAYEPGKRSTGLLKIKEFLDDEFEVVGFKESKTGWAICQCKTQDGTIFGVSAPGTFVEKAEVMENQDKYLGKFLTVEFAFLTNDGIPFQPTATRWRDDI